jgi:hypothetical protein
MSGQKILSFLFLVALGLAVVAFVNKGRLPTHREIRPELRQEPVQETITEPPFSIDYRGKNYDVHPVASYELWGLVVSHNQITSVADIYHDKNSLDTRDLCVIWGQNVLTEDYRNVTYKSGSFTCFYQYPDGVSFNGTELSNNHLITDNESIRRKIDQVHIGDQIHFTGLLVNYRDSAVPNFWRNTSTTRTDTWGGACEVVYVKALDILKEETHGWYQLFHLSCLALLAIALLKIISAMFL